MKHTLGLDGSLLARPGVLTNEVLEHFIINITEVGCARLRVI